MADESDEQSWRPIVLALAALAAVGWLAAGFIWWQGGQTQSRLTEQLAAAEAGARIPGLGPAEPPKDGRRRGRPEKAGGRRREGAVGRLDRKGVSAERARRPDQADQRRQTRHFRRPGRSERQDARFASRRRPFQGGKRPRGGSAEPGPSPFGRADPVARRRRRRAQGSRGRSDTDRIRAEGVRGLAKPDQLGDRRAQRPSSANSRGEASNGLEPESVTGPSSHEA